MMPTICGKSVESLKEVGFEIDQSKSSYTGRERTEWEHRVLSLKENIVVLGTEATEWNSKTADEEDASLARGRLEEACEFSGHVGE